MTQQFYLVEYIKRDVIVPGVGMVAYTNHQQIIPAISTAQAENIVKSAIPSAEEVSVKKIGRYKVDKNEFG